MAEPSRKAPAEEPWEPDSFAPDDSEDAEEATLLRWVERPGGRLEQVELPLTPELFLDPQVGDTMVQGHWHEVTGREITDLLARHFRSQPDVIVTHDLKHRFGRGQPAPAPDVSVIRGIRDAQADRQSFDAVAEGLTPCLVIEVVSPMSARNRRTDLETKVKAYARLGIDEYLILDRRRDKQPLYTLLGYCLEEGTNPPRYQPIEPDAEGRILSQTTGLWFQVSAERNRLLVFEASTGRRLLSSVEWEETATRQAEAREAAEAEVARLRDELARLRGQS